jgi:hypothetical protein
VTGADGIAHYDPSPSLKYRQHGQNVIGSNAGFPQRWAGCWRFFGCRLNTWNDTNIEALNSVRHLLAPSSLVTLDQFARARKARLPNRIYLLWESVLESFGIFVGSFLRRI